MDSLALLCNLHADGPATLQRLRRAGLESLAALRRAEAASLARTLDWDERVAQRFLREASHLALRTGEGEAEGEVFELESTLVGELDGTLARDEGDSEEDSGSAPEESEEEPASEPEGVAALLGAWRELDRVAPPPEPTDFLIPRPPQRADRRLDDLELEGLGTELRARLASKGIRTVRELAEAPELELARGLGLGFTRLKRLQFLARRVLEQEAVTRFDAYTPPPAEPFETAGPFA